MPSTTTTHSIGKYQIIEVLGEGGMATVFRAQFTGLAQAKKEVALKLIHQHLLHEKEFILMFLDEMRLAMALTHRNIVQTFDVGQSEDSYYMAMEFIEGSTLRQLLNRFPEKRNLPLSSVLFIAKEVCAALDYAHNFRAASKNQPTAVIHRDVCPSNILLSLNGDVKLTDFGIAKAAGRLTVSRVNTVKGKLRYIAPEQLNGISNPRSDIFSLGAVIYEMLFGEPYRRTVGKQHTNKSNVTPDEIIQRREDLSPGFAELVARCLAIDPQKRPASGAELGDALNNELFALQLKERCREDNHKQLQNLLAEVGIPSSKRQKQHSQDKHPIARALIEQAGEVPTDPAAVFSPTTLSPNAEETVFHGPKNTNTAPLSSEGAAGTTHLISKGAKTTILSPKRAAPDLQKPEGEGKRALNSEGEGKRALSNIEREETSTLNNTGRARRAFNITSRWRLLFIISILILGTVGGAVLIVFYHHGDHKENQKKITVQTNTEHLSPTASRLNSDAYEPPSRASISSPKKSDAVDKKLREKVNQSNSANSFHNLLPRSIKGSTRIRKRLHRKKRRHHRDFFQLSKKSSRSTARAQISQGYGWLDLNSYPWSEVYLDGQYHGFTPIQNLELSAGRHSIRLLNRKQKLQTSLTISIGANRRYKKVVYLKNKSSP